MKKQIYRVSSLLCVSLALIGSMLLTEGRAEYPDRPITLWVQYGPGGSGDLTNYLEPAYDHNLYLWFSMGNPDGSVSSRTLYS